MAGAEEQVLQKCHQQEPYCAGEACSYRPMLKCGGREGEGVPVLREGTGRNTERELFLESQPHATKAYRKLNSAAPFPPNVKELLHAMDGRVVSGPQAVVPRSCSDLSEKKLDDDIAHQILGNQTKKGAKKQKYVRSRRRTSRPNRRTAKARTRS